MNILDKYQNEIDAYVQGNMSHAAETDFEALMHRHPELREAVELLKSYKADYDNKDIYDLHRHLEILRKEQPPDEKETNKSNRWYVWLLAAAVVVVAVCTYYFTKGDMRSFEMEIKSGLADNNITDPAVVARRLNVPAKKRSMGATSAKDSPLDRNDSFFQDITVLFNKIHSDESYSDFTSHAVDLIMTEEYSEKYEAPTLLLIARAKLLDKNTDKALAALANIKRESPYYCYAIYYKSIAYAMENRKAKALATLDKNDCPEFEKAMSHLQEKIINLDGK